MKDWMEYVYMQQPMPTEFTGVQVTIDVIDSNGNYRNIGSATTDASGSFSLSWQPDIPGDYTVIASFKGTQGYWSSYAETSFAVDSAASTPTPTDIPIESPSEMYFVPAVAAIIVTIIVVGIVLALLLIRKKP